MFQSGEHLIYSSPATLAFNSPGAEGFGVKRAGLAVPGSIMLIVALLIKLTSPGPIIFCQERVGLHNRPFKMYKFRSMTVQDPSKEKSRWTTKGDARVTLIGKIIRRTSIDEVPQFFNILMGDMSLVGPRPERPELAKVITKNIPEFEYRLKVKAGLTGYAQVHGRYCTTSYDKLKLDLTYIRNYSIWLDLKLILMTPKVLLMKESTDGFEEGLWEDPALKE